MLSKHDIDQNVIIGIIDEYLKKEPFDSQKTTFFKGVKGTHNTLLHQAANYGHLEVVTFLGSVAFINFNSHIANF
jgi:hypothetical protein